MEVAKRVLQISDYPSANLSARKKKLKEEGKTLYDFGTGDPIEPTPDFIRESVARGVPKVSQYPTVKGTERLLETVAAYLKRRFAVDVDPKTEIIPCTGSKEAIYNIQFVLVEPGSKKNIVVGPTPGYPIMERSTVMAGGEYYPFQLNAANGYILDLATLPEAVLERTAIAWINYPHNPTGVECNLEYLRKQVEICKKYDILLCSDECYADHYFGSTPHPSILQVTTEGVLAFHSCSKRSGMTAYRSGFIAGDKKILKAFLELRNVLGVATPVYTQEAAIAAWGDDKHAEDRKEFFKAKRALFLDFFEEKKLKVYKTDATFYFWIECPNGLTGQEYAAQLMEHGIIVSPGEFFGTGCEKYFRIALVPSLEDCKKAIEIWRGI